MASFEIYKKDKHPICQDFDAGMIYIFVIPLRGTTFIAGPFTPDEAEAFMEDFETNEEIWRIIEDIKRIDKELELQKIEERREANLKAMEEKRATELQELERRRNELINALCKAAANIIEEHKSMDNAPTP